MGANAGKEFPYEVGDIVSTFKGHSAWTLHDGRCKKDDSIVSIFSFNLQRESPDRVACARNGMKRLKTLMHPSIIKYHGGVELSDRIYIVTEHVTPLCEELSTWEVSTDALAWGVHQVVNVVSFLHEQDIVHGNVNPYSVFVSDGGEWKLGMLDATSQDIDEVMHNIPSVVDRKYWPPEVQGEHRGTMSRAPLFSVDAYGLGCLIGDVFKQQGIPPGLRSMHRKLTASNPTRRLNPSHVSSADIFDNPFVNAMEFLDNAAAKEVPEMVEFVTKELPHVIESMPQRTLQHKVLPKLFMIMRFGGEACAVFSSIMKIVSRLPDEAVARHALPPILELLSANDSMIRLTILSHMEPFARHIDRKTTNLSVYPIVSVNLSHKLPQLREAALKSVVHVAPNLTAEHTNDMLKHLWKLQADTEAGIRTNTVVAFGKVASHLSETNRRRILIPAFTRALKDTFHHTRNASILALTATLSYYKPHALARHVLPAVSPCLSDPVRNVRESAFKLVHDIVRQLEDKSKADPSPFDPPETPLSKQQQQQQRQKQTQQMSSGGTDSYLSWAMSSLNKISSQAAAGVRGTISADNNDNDNTASPRTGRSAAESSHGLASMSSSQKTYTSPSTMINNGSNKDTRLSGESSPLSPFNTTTSTASKSSASSSSSVSSPSNLSRPKRRSDTRRRGGGGGGATSQRKPKGMQLKKDSVESEIKRRAAAQGFSLGRVRKTIRKWKDEEWPLDADQILAELGSGDRSWKKEAGTSIASDTLVSAETETPDEGWGDGWDELLEDSLDTGNKKQKEAYPGDTGDLIQLDEDGLDAWLDE